MKFLFATAINCIDGRIQIPVIEFIKDSYGFDYVDIVSEAGPNKILAENTDQITINSINKRVKITIDYHDSELIAIIGHHNCAANSADKITQLQQLDVAKRTIQTWDFDLPIIAIWVDEHLKPHLVE